MYIYNFVFLVRIYNLFSEVLMYENFNLEDIVTPINVRKFKQLLIETNYPESKTRVIVEGFTNGFPIGYQGVREGIQRNAPNLKLRVGGEIDLWNKVMKEVKLKRYAGPFKKVPFVNYIQSPIGLVTKDGGKDTRLIFHLSYPRNGQSVNSEPPKDICSVKYPDFQQAIDRCLEEGICPVIGKPDLKNAFHFVPIKIGDWFLLIMKAKNPINGLWYYFVDKCMPFSGSISCAHFQKISDALAHIQTIKTNGKIPINYLEDFLFIAMCKFLCDQQLETFLQICVTVSILHH